MAMQITCPHCAASMSGQARAAGKTVACLACGQSFRVPQPVDVLGVPEVSRYTKARETIEGGPKRKSASGGLSLLAWQIAVPIVSTLVLLFLMHNDSPRSERTGGQMLANAAALFGIFVAPVILHFALAVWIAKDVRARDGGGAVPVWVLIVFFVPVLGPVFYFCQR